MRDARAVNVEATEYIIPDPGRSGLAGVVVQLTRRTRTPAFLGASTPKSSAANDDVG